MNATSALNAFCKDIGLNLVTWEVRRSEKYVTEIRYESADYAQKIAAILKAALDFKEAAIGIVKSKEGGTRVIVRNFPQCQVKIDAALEALKQPKPLNMQDAQAHLQTLCNNSWTGETLRVGKILQDKFPAIEPSCFVSLRPLLQKGFYLLITESEYDDDDVLPKMNLLTDDDIKFISDTCKV